MKHETFKTESEKLLDLSKPSLETLSFMLRHRETWPPGFHWDYSHCQSCAFGLAHKIWRLTCSDGDLNRIAARWFGISKSAASRIFTEAAIKRSCYVNRVTPEMVADDIDAYLASRA